MQAKMILPRRSRLLAVLAMALSAASFARADLVISLTPVAAAPGTVNNAFDVDLTNTGLTDVTIGAFSFGLLADPAVTFTGANTFTGDPYIFAGDSLFGPDIATSAGATLIASDLFDLIGSGAVVAAGASVGLGHVLFDVASTAAGGVITVSLSPADTSLADPTAAAISIDRLADGQISLPVSSVPEPSPTWLLALTLPFFAAVRRRHQRR
jgi:hypothetical protein